MPLPKRPKVEILAPAACFAGQPTTVELRVIAEQETTIDFIDARIVGLQGWKIGSGKNQIRHEQKYPDLVVRLAGQLVLPVGTSRFTTTFTLPADMPPTHRLTPAWSQLELKIHVSVPWWPDTRERFALTARMPQPGPVPRTPAIVRSRATGEQPRLEVSLASSRLIAGETVVGSIAAFHVDDRKPFEVRMAVVPAFSLLGRRRIRERRGDGFDAIVTLPAGSAGTGVPFRFELPASIPPSFTTHTQVVTWFLEASIGSFFGGRTELAMPLQIVDAEAATSTPPLTLAPPLGDDRISAMFAHFAAAHGWQVEGVAMHRTLETCRLHFEYSYRGKDGTFLVARIEHRPLGLELVVTPSSALRHVFFEDIEVHIAAWDRAHHVAARSPAQTVPMLTAVVPTLMAVPNLGGLVRWDDDAIMFERAVVGIEEAELAAQAGALERLALAIEAAQRTITPPPGITVDLDAWTGLAHWLHGELTVGDLAIHGTLDELPVEISLGWDEQVRATHVHVTVGDPELASAAARQITLELPRPAGDVLATAASEQLIDQVTTWPVDFVDLRITDGVAAAAWVLPPAIDAARVRELVLGLRSLLLALDPGAGPYR